MSYIQSPVGAIEKIRLQPFPANCVSNLRVARVENVIVGVGPKGQVYSSQVRGNCYYNLTGRFEHTLLCLRKLGVLTEEQIAEHAAAAATRKKKDAEEYAGNALLREASVLGIKFTPAQQKKIDAAKPKTGGAA